MQESRRRLDRLMMIDFFRRVDPVGDLVSIKIERFLHQYDFANGRELRWTSSLLQADKTIILIRRVGHWLKLIKYGF